MSKSEFHNPLPSPIQKEKGGSNFAVGKGKIFIFHPPAGGSLSKYFYHLLQNKFDFYFPNLHCLE